MFDEPLPKQADLRKLAVRESYFNAKLRLSTMRRLEEIVVSDKGFVAVDLHIGIDEHRYRFVKGNIYCEAEVVCQRCLQAVSIDVGVDVHLQMVFNEEQARHLKGDIDPLIVGDDELQDLNEVVEDELLLSFPLVSNHAAGECSGKKTYESVSDDEVIVEEKKNPFSVLAKLKAGKE